MRTIKFRAWDTLNNEMIVCKSDDHFDISAFTGKVKRQLSKNYSMDADEYVVMQYTGLNDKNGKEIYEGDIVKGVVEFPQLLTGDTDENCNFKMGGEVYYDYSGFSLKVIESLCAKDRDGMGNYFNFIGDCGEVFNEKEVIGNIYQNPELLN